MDAIREAIAALADDALLSTAAAARILGRDRDTVGMHAANHVIGRKVGRMWIFTKTDMFKLAAIVEKGAGRPATPVPGEDGSEGDR